RGRNLLIGGPRLAECSYAGQGERLVISGSGSLGGHGFYDPGEAYTFLGATDEPAGDVLLVAASSAETLRLQLRPRRGPAARPAPPPAAQPPVPPPPPPPALPAPLPACALIPPSPNRVPPPPVLQSPFPRLPGPPISVVPPAIERFRPCPHLPSTTLRASTP